jgi:hypothetical protein
LHTGFPIDSTIAPKTKKCILIVENITKAQITSHRKEKIMSIFDAGHCAICDRPYNWCNKGEKYKCAECHNKICCIDMIECGGNFGQCKHFVVIVGINALAAIRVVQNVIISWDTQNPNICYIIVECFSIINPKRF